MSDSLQRNVREAIPVLATSICHAAKLTGDENLKLGAVIEQRLTEFADTLLQQARAEAQAIVTRNQPRFS